MKNDGHGRGFYGSFWRASGGSLELLNLQHQINFFGRRVTTVRLDVFNSSQMHVHVTGTSMEDPLDCVAAISGDQIRWFCFGLCVHGNAGRDLLICFWRSSNVLHRRWLHRALIPSLLHFAQGSRKGEGQRKVSEGSEGS